MVLELIAETKGSITITVDNGRQVIHLKEVLYVERLTHNLLSVTRILAQGQFGVNFSENTTSIYFAKDGENIVTAKRKKNLFWIPFSAKISALAGPVVNNSKKPITEKDRLKIITFWHRALAHINKKYLREIIAKSPNMPKVTVKDDDFNNCFMCAQTKLTRNPHISERECPERPFELICTDVLDLKATSTEGHKYVITFIDAHFGYMKIEPIKKKSEIGIKWA